VNELKKTAMGKRLWVMGERQEVMGKKGFKNLIVWKKAKELAVTVYKLSEDKALGRDFGLRDQIRRSAVSIPIASRLLPLAPNKIDQMD